MTFQYASDLHLEFSSNKLFLKENPLQPAADILLLAGDIVPLGQMAKHKDFFSYVSEHFQKTYWLPGNHEYYQTDLSKKRGRIHEKIRSNVILINNDIVRIKDTNLIFSTLWSRLSPANQWYIERNMQDFQQIRNGRFRLNPDVYNELHQESREFIHKALTSEKETKKVVISHHCPTFQHYPEQYRGSLLNEAFAVELHEFIAHTQPEAWIYGHHHTNTPTFGIGQTQLLTNQLGYVYHNEHRQFNVKAVFTID